VVQVDQSNLSSGVWWTLGGIGGIYHIDGRPVDDDNLERLAGALAHRGPDGQGLWHEGSVGLAHQMLWTTPESCRETLPLVSRSGHLVLTADARLDNREELIRTLGLTARPPGEITDSDLILAAYERWGDDCPQHLVGDFAWVLWDGPRQSLLAARDHFGVRPFYYYLDPGRTLVFASEIQAILTVPGVPRRLNEMRVAEFLIPLCDDTAITFYKGILRLPQASCLRVGREGRRLWSYWSLDPSRELRLKSPRDYQEGFRSHFFEAVRSRLRSAFPVGVMLSGGLDSSAVTCVARHLLASAEDGPLHTFSAIFDAVPESDERHFIKTVVAQGNLKPHFVHGDEINPLGDHETTLDHADEPIAPINLFLLSSIYQAAQRQGVRILLSGSAGDSIVSHGLELLPELAITGKWLSLLRELQELPKKFQPYHRLSPWKLFWYHTLRPLIPEALRDLYRQKIRQCNSPRDPERLFHPDFARRLDIKERFQAIKKDKGFSGYSARGKHCSNLTQGVDSFMLEIFSKASARFGVELRCPFFDKRLAEFCLALPADQKLERGWTRLIMRRSLAPYLPRDICWRRSKSTLRPNFTRGMVKFARERLDQVILGDDDLIAGYVNLPGVRAAYRRYLSTAFASDEFTVWKAASLALWLQRTGLTP
jgi:asparagine synthase (glutamine-hydrolysing)